MPFQYTPEARQEAIEAVLKGLSAGTPLTIICAADGFPCVRSITSWAEEDPELSAAIARARDAGFDRIAMDALDIADDNSADTKVDENGNERPDNEWISRSKLRVETRLKLLAKWDPKRYGDMLKLADNEGGKLSLADAITAGNARVNGADNA